MPCFSVIISSCIANLLPFLGLFLVFMVMELKSKELRLKVGSNFVNGVKANGVYG